jgi:hypothetical protein
VNGDTHDEATTKFMLAEYEDLYQNVMHLENKLFAHLSFYTTLFMGVFTASIAILGLVMSADAPVASPWIAFLLALIFGVLLVVSRFELRMTTELRIRKMKFIEGITQSRQYFVDKDPSIAQYIVLPVGRHKAPPYLRVRSKDWYQVIYLSVMNGLAASIAWTLVLWPFVAVSTAVLSAPAKWVSTALMVPPSATQTVTALLERIFFSSLAPIWLVAGLFFGWVVFYQLSYCTIMDFCADYDKRREQEMKSPSEYDLFERPLPDSWLRRSLGDWLSWFHHRTEKSK